MLTQEQSVEIQVLKKQGRSIRQIARETGLSRNTVRRYLRERRTIGYGPREPRPCKLDPYKAFLQERIAQARPEWIPATVLLREIRSAGYEGGISQLKAYLTPFKIGRLDPVVRFETEPGRQMQADTTACSWRTRTATAWQRWSGPMPRGRGARNQRTSSSSSRRWPDGRRLTMEATTAIVAIVVGIAAHPLSPQELPLRCH
jgi:hypothetical protein